MPLYFAPPALKFVMPALKSVRNMMRNIARTALKSVVLVLKSAEKWQQNMYDIDRGNAFPRFFY
jgi:hypothetical protein